MVDCLFGSAALPSPHAPAKWSYGHVPATASGTLTSPRSQQALDQSTVGLEGCLLLFCPTCAHQLFIGLSHMLTVHQRFSLLGMHTSFSNSLNYIVICYVSFLSSASILASDQNTHKRKCNGKSNTALLKWYITVSALFRSLKKTILALQK